MYQSEEFDKLKTKILKYVLYKKRTEKEVREKFLEFDGQILDDAIQYLKEAGYINDQEFIERSMNEFVKLKNLSIRELQYKLITKGVDRYSLEDFMESNKEELINYEIQSAKNILLKKVNLQNSEEIEEILEYLYRKGYSKDNVKIAIEKI